ncbi:hypothetical protein [Methylomarinum vadi]|uniref:hypothetical protein n=1 Tax=Methylomarinum vadi TaxID=438855 RepID=UPI0004DF85D1|nr:hypothetical protein [Methylomarinum vadi]
MQTNHQLDPVLRRLRWVTGSVVLILILWQFLPWFDRYLIDMTSEPRVVTARSELAADERTTIKIFE